MFREAAAIGGLDVQLVYYRGLARMPRLALGLARPTRLAELMEQIDCRGGHTQIGKVLAHAQARDRRARRCRRWSLSAMPWRRALDDLCALRRRARAARRAGLHVPGGRRPGCRAGVPRDRPADRAAPIAASIRAPRTNSPSCCGPPPPMRPAACKALADLSARRGAGSDQAARADEIAMPTVHLRHRRAGAAAVGAARFVQADPRTLAHRAQDRRRHRRARGSPASSVCAASSTSPCRSASPASACSAGCRWSMPGFGARTQKSPARCRACARPSSRWSSTTTPARCADAFSPAGMRACALDALDVPTLVGFLPEIDEESRALLMAYLDRREPSWREHAQGGAAAGPGRASGAAAK